MLTLLIALIPLFIVVVGHFMFPSKISILEVAAGAVAAILIAVVLVSVGKYTKMADVELWNGEITGKDYDISFYSIPYECNCTGTGTDRQCSTCYNEGYNMYWTADSNIGSFTIQYKDCDSTSKSWCERRYTDPKRWLEIKKGDPVTTQNTYVNYIKAAEYSLFSRTTGDMSKAPDFEYPIKVYDHYHVDRVLLDGVILPNNETLDQWNRNLEQILKTLGPQKQANMILVLTNAANPSYAELLLTKWEGGNKNDIIIVAGFPSGEIVDGPEWVKVHSWAKKDIFNVTMRDNLLDNPSLWSSANVFFPNSQHIVMENFERRPMKEFEYLKNQIEPSTGMIVIMIIISIMAGVGLVFVFHQTDVFNPNNSSRRNFLR